MFSKLLIANRGEIACRIMRTARRLGIVTVAVYSDADRDALHVTLADEAVHIGASAPAASYLDIDKVIAAAKRSGADAIHPGYGFLSENARFARACDDAGIAFVGPPVAAIEAMGSKSAAKTIMEKAGVPLLPGFHGADPDPATLQAAARDIGYPVLLKAAAGGGGKGMRIVDVDEDFDAALAAAQREARGAFGDDTMLVEKYLGAPRHIELQVFADTHGSTVHLFDRDCSIQRRHQKIIEEAPAPGLSQSLRDEMANAAIEAARAIDYVGAGTVEFLLDRDGGFYFMEMNTRLQVEHPVTEMVTGLDLVEWQLRVAAGEPLPLAQGDIRCVGHAIEARVYAEDTDNNFLPTSGRLDAVRLPAMDDGIRIDSGVRAGDLVSVFYDPMIAKLIAFGADREAARLRLVQALDGYLIAGVINNLAFLRRAVASQRFAEVRLDTHFIDNAGDALAPGSHDDAHVIAAALLVWQRMIDGGDALATCWRDARAWRANLPATVPLGIELDGNNHAVALHFEPRHAMPVAATVGEQHIAIALATGADALQLDIDGYRRDVNFAASGNAGIVAASGSRHRYALARVDTGNHKARRSDGSVRAPMTGRVVRVDVAEGDHVEAGQTLLLLEAMKMEHTLKAPIAGTVSGCRARAEQLIDGGAVLVTITADTEEE